MLIKTIGDVFARTAQILKPTERLTVSEAAEKYRVLNNPGSHVGPWDNTRAPYLVEVMDTFSSLDFTSVIFAGPARSGKSDIVFNWLIQSVLCDPADILMVMMTSNVARDWSVGDLRKVFRDTKVLGEHVMPGKQHMNVHDVRFVNGMRMLIKWPAISELSGKTVPRVWLADYDRMPQDIEKEGSPYALAKKRTQTYNRFGMTVAESSPGFPITDPKWRPDPNYPHEAPPCGGILSLYNRGDRRRWYWQCVDCQHAFEPDFSNIVWPEAPSIMESAERATMVCPHCGSVYEHDGSSDGKPGKDLMNQKHAKWIRDGMTWNPDGTVTGTPLRTDTASFWLKGPAAMFTNWRTLVYNYLVAQAEYDKTGQEEALKTTTNVDQGLPYLPKASESDRLPEDYKSRARDLGDRVVPEGVRFLVATVDVQRNRFVVQVHGVADTSDVYVIDRFSIAKSHRVDEDGDPLPLNPAAYLEDWDVLIDKVLLATYPLSDGSGRRMQIKLVGSDSGGRDGVTKNAYNFYRRLRDDAEGRELHRRFLLLKGGSNPNAPRIKLTYPDSDNVNRHAGAMGEIPVLLMNTNMLKDDVHASLLRDTPDGGYIHIPDWIPDWFYVELTVEKRTAKGWENPRKARNEAWDLLVYLRALCLSRAIRLDTIDWSDPPAWADEWDVNSMIVDDNEDDTNRFGNVGDYETVDLRELADQLA